MEGQGIMEWSDGNKYVGSWKDGKMHGQGTYTWGDSKKKYVGKFENGIKHGAGEYTWSNGNSFKGTWKDGKLDGKVIEKQATMNGRRESTWSNGERVSFVDDQQNPTQQVN